MLKGALPAWSFWCGLAGFWFELVGSVWNAGRSGMRKGILAIFAGSPAIELWAWRLAVGLCFSGVSDRLRGVSFSGFFFFRFIVSLGFC